MITDADMTHVDRCRQEQGNTAVHAKDSIGTRRAHQDDDGRKRLKGSGERGTTTILPRVSLGIGMLIHMKPKCVPI